MSVWCLAAQLTQGICVVGVFKMSSHQEPVLLWMEDEQFGTQQLGNYLIHEHGDDTSPHNWNELARVCFGVNRGKKLHEGG